MLQPLKLLGLCFSSKLALTDMQRPPSEGLQISVDAPVTHTVGIDLGFPELGSGLGKPEQMAVVSMPETTVNKDHCAVAMKNQIRAPRQACSTQSVSQPGRMQRTANLNFDTRIFALDTGHLLRPFLGTDDIQRAYAAFLARFSGFFCTASKCRTIIPATSAMTGTTTEFPNCL